MSKLVSVIIPVYKTEEYLRGCVDSVLSQTHGELEVILVDDGSPDGCGKICDEYAKKDARVRVIHKENGGQGSARNAALDVIRGDYVAFVDSDDKIAPTMYEVLLADMEEHGADIACCALSDTEEATGAVLDFSQPQIMREHLGGCAGLNQSPCNKLFKARLFDGVRYTELRAYEDCATLFFALAKAERAVFRDTVMYYYEKRENSTMTQPFSRVKYQSILAYEAMHRFYAENFPQYADTVKVSLLGAVQYCVGETVTRGMKKEYVAELRAARNTARRISYRGLNFKRRLALFLIKHAPSLYGALYRAVK